MVQYQYIIIYHSTYDNLIKEILFSKILLDT